MLGHWEAKMSQKFCEIHNIWFEYKPMEGRLNRGLYNMSMGGSHNSNAMFGCPQCIRVAPGPKLLKLAGFILLFFAFLFYKIPKMIYGKFGKKGVIIYFACWLGVVITLVAVNEYNLHQERVAREKYQAEERAARMEEEGKRQVEELKAKMRESQERVKQTKAKKAEEERIAAKWQKIEEGWAATSEQEYNLKGAIKYCSSRGWRLSNNKDWEALAKFLKGEPKLYDKFAIQGGGYWWSATKLDDHEGYAYAWTITGSGFYSDSRPEYETFYARCIKK